MTTLYRFDGKKLHAWCILETMADGRPAYYTKTWQETVAKISDFAQAPVLGMKNVKMSESKIPTPKKGQTHRERLLEVIEQQVAKKLRDGYTPEKIAKPRYSPMLAKPFEAKKLVGPKVAIQPKLDGVRCITRRENGANVAYSREMRQHPPHIQRMVAEILLQEGDYLDGELILPMDLHGEKSESQKATLFQATVSAVKKESFMSGLLLYAVYDLANTERSETFSTRLENLKNLCQIQGVPFTTNNILLEVETTMVELNEEELETIARHYVENGFEGAMVRPLDVPYAFDKRSDSLMKLKFFDDAEFQIVGYEYGVGKNQDVITWILRAPNGEEFRAVQSGSDREWSPERADEVLGWPLTVRYQGLTASGVPRFPIGIAVRDYE